MKLFSKRKIPEASAVQVGRRAGDAEFSANLFRRSGVEAPLYESLRNSVPVIDAAIGKIVRLAGGVRLVSSDEIIQDELDYFAENIPVGLSGRGVQAFLDGYLDSLLTYGNAVGEILPHEDGNGVMGLYLGDSRDIEVRAGKSPVEPEFFRKTEDGEVKLPKPQFILFSALNPPPNQVYGKSVLSGLPYISSILMRVYECIGQNFDRIGNVRYAVTYKPQDSSDRAYAKERAIQIANEWSEGMQASRNGEVRDFVAVGDVDIKVIGADNQVLSTEIPVRQLLEQIIAKLSIPPFLLGFSWSSTERMSAQQADILTSELEFYRRLLTPVARRIGEAFLRLSGSDGDIKVQWDNINLQDEAELAEARLKNAQAEEIELRNMREKSEMTRPPC